jgi:hypothetical protein
VVVVDSWSLFGDGRYLWFDVRIMITIILVVVNVVAVVDVDVVVVVPSSFANQKSLSGDFSEVFDSFRLDEHH